MLRVVNYVYENLGDKRTYQVPRMRSRETPRREVGVKVARCLF